MCDGDAVRGRIGTPSVGYSRGQKGRFQEILGEIFFEGRKRVKREAFSAFLDSLGHRNPAEGDTGLRNAYNASEGRFRKVAERCLTK
jgi:hypothetical protein